MNDSSAQQKAQVQAYFSRTAASYVASSSHRQGKDLTRLVELGEFLPEHYAIDMATGGGHTALVIAPHVGQIMVTDLTPTMLEQARAFLLAQGVTNTHFQLADAEALPFVDETFDRVHDYDNWTARSQMPAEEKARLEHFILSSDESIRRYFDVRQKTNGHVQQTGMDYILLKARKL